METDADDSGAIAAPSVRGGLDPDAARLFRVYRTISNMLTSRDYMVPREMREMTPASFKARFKLLGSVWRFGGALVAVTFCFLRMQMPQHRHKIFQKTFRSGLSYPRTVLTKQQNRHAT